MTPAFEENFKVVLFDHVGFGNSDLKAFDRDRYATLKRYARMLWISVELD